MAKNVCDVIIEVLSERNVEFIFGIPGDAINGLLEAIRKQNKIKFIHVRHEEAGAFAASAISKLTGKLAVCVGTAGPGAVHLLNGLYDAKHDGASVLAITGQVPTEYEGTEYHQEVDLHSLFEEVSVYNEIVINAHTAQMIVEKACRAAYFRKGVAHLMLPLDIALEKAPEMMERNIVYYSIYSIVPEEGEILKAAKMLNESGKVAIMAGFGARNAVKEMLLLAQKLNAPIIKPLRGKSNFPDEHSYSVGGTGRLGTKPAINAANNCDCLLMIGTDFPYTEFLPKHKKIIQIDNNPIHIGNRLRVDIGLAGDSLSTINTLLPLVNQKQDNAYLKGLQEEMKEWWKKMDEEEQNNKEPIAPQMLARLVGKLADDDAIFCCDTGTVTVWAARHIRIREGQEFTLSGGLASMAFGLPAAIGAKLTYPRRQVIALCGDGGFAMLMGDFLTAVQYNLPIIVIIFNNHKLGLIQMEQEVMGWPEYETHLHNPDFSAFAKICGGDGEKVSKPQDLEQAILNAYNSGKPYILDVEVNPGELTTPPEITVSQAIGFAKAKVKEFFGAGDSQ